MDKNVISEDFLLFGDMRALTADKRNTIAQMVIPLAHIWAKTLQETVFSTSRAKLRIYIIRKL